MSNSLPAPVASRLVRSTTDRRIAGVCGGLGEYFGIDPIFVRLAFMAAVFVGVSLLLYPILWIVMPKSNGAATIFQQGMNEVRTQFNQASQRYTSAQPNTEAARFDPFTGQPINNRVPRFDPYTGQPLPVEETAIPLTNATVAPLTPQVQRRKRLLGMGLVAFGLIAVSDTFFLGALVLPLLLIGAGIMVLRRAK